LKCLVRGGRIVTCGATIGDQPPADTSGNCRFSGRPSVTRTNSQRWSNGAEQGVLFLLIDVRYPLDQLRAALAHLESGTQFGKIAIDIEPGAPFIVLP
jgi:NADPH:quinone reductase-like Zn-dependent oxidoreductase